MQAGDVLAERYRLDDLLAENGAGRFWRAHDLVLHRPVSVHILLADDDHTRVVGPDMRLGEKRKGGQIVLVVRGLAPDEDPLAGVTV